MYRVVLLGIIQSVLLVTAQVTLKLAMSRMLPFGWNKDFWYSVLLNWQFALSGVSFGAASLLWLYILKHFPFGTAYPLISLSYVFGMIAAIIFFHESVSIQKWIGVGLIMIGCCLIAK